MWRCLRREENMQTYYPGDHHSLTAPKPTLNFPESSETESRPLQFSRLWAANHRVNLAEIRSISGPVDNLIEDVHYLFSEWDLMPSWKTRDWTILYLHNRRKLSELSCATIIWRFKESFLETVRITQWKYVLVMGTVPVLFGLFFGSSETEKNNGLWL